MLELYAVAVYDNDSGTLTLTKELAHNKLVAARVALANFCVEDMQKHVSYLDLQTAMRDIGLDIDVVCLMDS